MYSALCVKEVVVVTSSLSVRTETKPNSKNISHLKSNKVLSYSGGIVILGVFFLIALSQALVGILADILGDVKLAWNIAIITLILPFVIGIAAAINIYFYPHKRNRHLLIIGIPVLRVFPFINLITEFSFSLINSKNKL